MSKPKLDTYEKIIKSKPPEIAAEILATLCREKDKMIAELKGEGIGWKSQLIKSPQK